MEDTVYEDLKDNINLNNNEDLAFYLRSTKKNILVIEEYLKRNKIKYKVILNDNTFFYENHRSLYVNSYLYRSRDKGEIVISLNDFNHHNATDFNPYYPSQSNSYISVLFPTYSLSKSGKISGLIINRLMKVLKKQK